MSYLSRIDHAFSDAPVLPLSENGRYVLFSDRHRGIGTSNDNFLKNQHLYFAALNYYYQHSFCYIELGDGDELWENRSFSAIQNIHSNVFWLLSLFYEEHRLFMLFGNHDIAKKDFHPFSDCCFHEGLRLKDCVTGQELYLTQPTVSAHIQTLEKELKVRLFVRNTKTVKLSEDGKTLYQYARQMIELEQEIQSMFSKAAEQKERCITIATSTIPAQYILPDILVKFRERFPEEQFRIVESDSSTVIEQVASHLVDIGFSGTVIEKANCKYIPFYQDDLVVIMPNTKEYQKIVKEQKDLKWLEGEPLIMREEGSGTRKEAEKQLKKMGISLDDLNIVATIENPEAIKRSVKSGLGITIISRLAAADEIQAGEVLEFPFSQDGSGRNLNLVYNKNYKLPAAAEHVRELIIEKYELKKQSLQ